jgi:hypothetical protein
MHASVPFYRLATCTSCLVLSPRGFVFTYFRGSVHDVAASILIPPEFPPKMCLHVYVQRWFGRCGCRSELRTKS